MIEDFDGPEPPPRRRGAMRVLSVIVAVGAFVGYAAASSTTFQGPFATPQPSVVAATAVPWSTASRDSTTFVFDPSGGPLVWAPGPGCVVMPVASPVALDQVIFVGGRDMTTIVRDVRSLPTCPPGLGVRWGEPPNMIPLDRASH